MSHFAAVGRISVSGFGLFVNGIFATVPLGILPLRLELGKLPTVGNRRVELPYQKQGKTDGDDADDDA